MDFQHEPIWIYDDHPKDDAEEFNFGIYADRITNILLTNENKPPFTIAINSPWGSGKTTLMKTVKKKLDDIDYSSVKFRKVKTVWFDAWKYAETGSLLSALALEIHQNVVKNSEKELRFRDKIGYFLNTQKINKKKIIEDFVNFSISNIKLINGIQPLSSDRLNVSQWVNSPIYEDNLSYYKRFNQYLDAVISIWFGDKKGDPNEKNNGILVIFIDDLDRCPPSAVTNILESINLFFDQGQCAFVLGMDVPKVAHLVDAQYREYTHNSIDEKERKSNSGFSGSEYIKKILQIQFNLPSLRNESLENYFRKSFKLDDVVISMTPQIIYALKEKNIREVKSFVNKLTLFFKLEEAIDDILISKEIMTKWTILEFLEHEFIEKVKDNPLLLVAINDSISNPDNFSDNIEYLSSNYHIKSEDEVALFNEYKQNDRIISTLEGEEAFDENSVKNCLYLSSIMQSNTSDNGEVTIAYEGTGTYHIGDEIKFSGTNTASNKTFLFITGPNLHKSGSKLDNVGIKSENKKKDTFTGIHVESDDTWGYKLITSNIAEKLKEGEYTIYAVSSPHNLNELSKTKYSIRKIFLKRPFLNAQLNKSTLAIGDKLTISGTATGAPEKVYIWIFGTNEIHYQPTEVSADGNYAYVISPSISRNFEPGQYFIVIQHPMENGRPDVIFENNRMIPINFVNGVQTSIKNLQSSDAAMVLIDYLNKPDCDDTYRKLTFMVEKPWVRINPVSDQKIGSTMDISGTTNIDAENELSVSLRNGDEVIMLPNTNIFKAKGAGYNTWSISFNSEGLNPGSYIIKIDSLEHGLSNEVSFNLVK